MNKTGSLLECCLFFTANALARTITRMGEEAFAGLGMAPSYAFLLALVIDKPGILQKELAHHLQMAPSTVSRFVYHLLRKGYIKREAAGRNCMIYPTETGKKMKPAIDAAWRNLYERYSRVLGREQGAQLTELTGAASSKLQGDGS